ncbi:MAG: AraC family transcriptional regulator [Moraxellaceae bacterium]|nr:MAG: AraC family transcriptional regulator [Moraxellaceae bacterium]
MRLFSWQVKSHLHALDVLRLDPLENWTPKKMSDFNQNTQLENVGVENDTPLRFEHLEPLLLAGIREPLTDNAEKEIPILWQSFLALIDKIAHKIDNNRYGVCVQTGEYNREYYYMACCAVSDLNDMAEEFSPIIIPSQEYAVFTHRGHLSQIRQTISFAFDVWLPASTWSLTRQSTHTVHFFEKYTEEFDPSVGVGGIEIWVPITRVT